MRVSRNALFGAPESGSRGKSMKELSKSLFFKERIMGDNKLLIAIPEILPCKQRSALLRHPEGASSTAPGW
jgi:hypothetical protein